ncbi:small-conductance calcium-activated potassium channel protein (macronuclear) [Tetrahymena thermophila SB210]|uniref:Small-conductance calcium-activated potassium channel protein n=1 Tax=Tetrahymena thermophila (strain SB210) TaxID=312017 RepID=I7MMQ2_TETTS|nr:small-conductance calcium-activated potassium channel protein [Tetrahymena thermophila SB210]EAS06190.2 small-conductance calcium-activated potassium channel protein [Tetrahymena thermophila SB210]|eukprot:XP_001026435.2 small-conductance calcium-activated potassium channel protein [Tetrahymena thermophila SB210]
MQGVSAVSGKKGGGGNLGTLGIPINPFFSQSKKRSQVDQLFDKKPHFAYLQSADGCSEQMQLSRGQKSSQEGNENNQIPQEVNLKNEKSKIQELDQQNLDKKQASAELKQTIQDFIQIEEDQNIQLGRFEDGRKTKAYYSRFILIDQAISSFSVLSIIIAVLEYDLEFNAREEFIAKALLYMTFLLTIGMITLTVIRYQAKLEWLKTRQAISQKANLITSGYLKSMIIEIIISAVHPMPWTWQVRLSFFNDPTQATAYYHLNEIFLLIMLLRVLLIVRTLLTCSVWYNNRTQRVCNMYAVEVDYLFTVKGIMETQPYALIISALIISILYFGFMIRICEAPLYRNQTDGQLLLYSFSNSLWVMLVTMTTLGYGDYCAKTSLGRFITFLVCIWGVFIVSMMVITLSKTLELTTLEEKSIAVLQRLRYKELMKNHAARSLTILAKIGLANRKGLLQGQHKKELQSKLRDALNKFMKALRAYKSIVDTNINEEMGRQFDFLNEDLMQIQREQNEMLMKNIQMMQQLQIDKQQIEYYAKHLSKNSVLQMKSSNENNEKNIDTNLDFLTRNNSPKIECIPSSNQKLLHQDQTNNYRDFSDQKIDYVVNIFTDE